MCIVAVHLVTKCSAAPSWPAEPRGGRGRGRGCPRVAHSQPQRGVQLQAGPRRPRGQHGGQLGGQLCGGGGPGGEQEPLARPAPGVVAPPPPSPRASSPVARMSQIYASPPTQRYDTSRSWNSSSSSSSSSRVVHNPYKRRARK